MRPNGFYWVCYNHRWSVACWENTPFGGDKANWTLPGDELTYDDLDFDEIGEQIERKTL